MPILLNWYRCTVDGDLVLLLAAFIRSHPTLHVPPPPQTLLTEDSGVFSSAEGRAKQVSRYRHLQGCSSRWGNYRRILLGVLVSWCLGVLVASCYYCTPARLPNSQVSVSVLSGQHSISWL